MTTHQHHPQLAIDDGIVEIRRVLRSRRGQTQIEFMSELFLFACPARAASQVIKRTPPRCLQNPRGRIVGNPSERPDFHRADQGVLHHVLGQLEVLRAKIARDHRDQLTGLGSKQPFDCFGRLAASGARR